MPVRGPRTSPLTAGPGRGAVLTRDVALTIQTAYVLLAFGWRSWLQWRRTGDTGLRLSPESPALDRTASLLIVGGAGLGFAGIAAGSGGGGHLLGVLVMLAGLTTTLKAQLDLGRSWRIGVDHHERTDLVTTGAFALARNPIFTGMSVVGLGTALAAPNTATVAGAALLIAGVQAQVRLVEEPYLLEVHGDDFRAYASRTGRFLPGIGQLPEFPPKVR